MAIMSINELILVKLLTRVWDVASTQSWLAIINYYYVEKGKELTAV